MHNKYVSNFYFTSEPIFKPKMSKAEKSQLKEDLLAGTDFASFGGKFCHIFFITSLIILLDNEKLFQKKMI